MNHGATVSPDWIEQIGGLAAVLRPSPWRFTPNAALQGLLGADGQGEAEWRRAFDAGGELSEPLRRGEPFHGRLRLEPAAHGHGARLLHADLAPMGNGDWLCTVVDLSDVEERRGRRALTLRHLRHTLDQLQELMSMVTEGETMLFTNVSFARFYSTTPDQAEGRSVLTVMGEENHAMTAPFRAKAFRTLRPVRYERPLVSGEGEDRVMDVLLWPIPGGPGQMNRMATLTRDVTLRHRGMQALRQTLERLNALFEAGIEGILLCDQGVITDANPIASRHTGLERQQLVGLSLAQVLDRLGVPPEAWAGGGQPIDLSLSLLPGAHDKPPMQIQAITFMDGDSPCQAVLIQDMSYRYQAQRRIDRLLVDLRWQTERAEAADRGKSVFLASASHDLRQPIHALGLFLTTIRSLSHAPSPLSSKPFVPIVQRMRASLDSLMELLNMLLGASLHGTGQKPLQPRPTPLQAPFDDMVSEFAAMAARKGLSLHAVPSRAWVLADPTVLRRVLTNLVSNAVRYTQQGRIVLGARRRGASVEVQVWDTGIGIPPEKIDAIFQEFFRVDTAPTRDGRSEGLGLSIVRRAAAQLGARLDVRSMPGKGSMFSVRLPQCDPQRQEQAPAPDDPPPAGTGRHILLIDDDEQVLLATTHLLTSWGHQVLSAANASEALRLCEAQPMRIDTVICDYMLDPSMDGLELLLGLRARHLGPLPVCMVTGDMSAERIEQANRHGFTLLHKPVSAEALQRFLRAAG